MTTGGLYRFDDQEYTQPSQDVSMDLDVLKAGLCENAKGERDVLFFGFVEGIEREFGYSSLVELQALRGLLLGASHRVRCLL